MKKPSFGFESFPLVVELSQWGGYEHIHSIIEGENHPTYSRPFSPTLLPPIALYLIIVFRRATQNARLAFNALPRVLPHGDYHVLGELEAGRVA